MIIIALTTDSRPSAAPLISRSIIAPVRAFLLSSIELSRSFSLVIIPTVQPCFFSLWLDT